MSAFADAAAYMRRVSRQLRRSSHTPKAEEIFEAHCRTRGAMVRT